MLSIASAKDFLQHVQSNPQEAVDAPFCFGTIETDNPLCVAFDGDVDANGAAITTPVSLAHLVPYTPLVGDRVLLLDTGKTWVVMGAVTPTYRVLTDGVLTQLSWADFVGTVRTLLTALPTITIPAWAMQSGASTIDIVLNAALTLITAASNFSLDLTTSSTGWPSNPASGDTSTTPRLLTNSVAASQTTDAIIAGTWTIPTLASGATASFVPRLNGVRTSGTGGLRSVQGVSNYHWRIHL